MDKFNCPVVAYYPEVLRLNVPELKNLPFVCDFLPLHNEKKFRERIAEVLGKHFPELVFPKNALPPP